MRFNRLLALLLLPLVLLLASTSPALARSSELTDPDPVAIPAGTTAAEVARAIKTALVGRNWTVSNEEPGKIDATLHLRAHVARIAITYDAAKVRIAYVNSENLNFKEKNGKRTIHSNYLSWIGNLLGDISRNLQMAH